MSGRRVSEKLLSCLGTANYILFLVLFYFKIVKSQIQVEPKEKKTNLILDNLAKQNRNEFNPIFVAVCVALSFLECCIELLHGRQ